MGQEEFSLKFEIPRVAKVQFPKGSRIAFNFIVNSIEKLYYGVLSEQAKVSI
ncbi:hypothetical protein EYZ11_006780 [Aspergillus tanneri]|uniref:Uncharacterized protein n=1 Tax=Aspergillus tanneri TaxID=1220188 RepID=A0A4S3JEY2_9EURO|nr:hypothetical protein EYZ11_006780 [Aspergillus tanneri]